MVTIDLSNAGFWVQFGVYLAAVIAGVIYYFKKRKAGEVAPPQLMKMFTDQTTMVLQWFWKAVADGVITQAEAAELKAKLQANFDTTIDMIIKLYTPPIGPLIPDNIIIDGVADPIPEPIPEPLEDEIAVEEPPDGGAVAHPE